MLHKVRVFSALWIITPLYLLNYKGTVNVSEYHASEKDYDDKFPMCQACGGKGFDETETGDWDVCKVCTGFGLAQ